MNAKNIFANCTDALHLKTYLHSFSLFSYMSIINLNIKKQILWYVQSSWRHQGTLDAKRMLAHTQILFVEVFVAMHALLYYTS
jgi:hypothetical protein